MGPREGYGAEVESRSVCATIHRHGAEACAGARRGRRGPGAMMDYRAPWFGNQHRGGGGLRARHRGRRRCRSRWGQGRRWSAGRPGRRGRPALRRRNARRAGPTSVPEPRPAGDRAHASPGPSSAAPSARHPGLSVPRLARGRARWHGGRSRRSRRSVQGPVGSRDVAPSVGRVTRSAAPGWSSRADSPQRLGPQARASVLSVLSVRRGEGPPTLYRLAGSGAGKPRRPARPVAVAVERACLSSERLKRCEA